MSAKPVWSELVLLKCKVWCVGYIEWHTCFHFAGEEVTDFMDLFLFWISKLRVSFFVLCQASFLLDVLRSVHMNVVFFSSGFAAFSIRFCCIWF